MPIRLLDEWAVTRTNSLPLSALQGAVVGIDASHYISQHLLNPATREPLLVALGGFPFALKNNIERELQAFKDLGVACLFVFNGLNFGTKYQRPTVESESVRAFEQAWDLYDQQRADQVVDAFSGAVWGPSEVLLFDVDKVITRVDTDPAQVVWLSKHMCQETMGRLTSEQFLEFCLLLGSSFLPTFPMFDNSGFPGKSPSVRDALPMFNAAGRSALALCAQFEDDRRLEELNYTDRYKRAYMTVKHHVFMDEDGHVGPVDVENASSDMHELISLRLPEELYFYLSKGVLGSDVPNYLTSGEVLISQPLGVEDTEIYRQVTSSMLTPIRTQSIGLLSNSLHRFYQTKVISVRTWYDDNSDININLKSLPSVKESIQSWKIRSDQLPETVKKLQGSYGHFRFAAQSLREPEFAPKSFSPKDAPALSSQEEILNNVFWRFLQLRGYIDESSHQLTPWGVCLEQALSVLGPDESLEEATFLAIEMLRLGLLNAKPWFSEVSGGPMRGSDEDKNFNMLVSRVACIAKLQHKSIGYSGPLSRQLLCYRSLITEVRAALRNLLEVVLTGLFLSGDADRDRKDWSEMSVKLPFIDDNDCGLGIAMRTYLDDLPLQSNPTSPEARAEVKSKGKDWFQHSESFTSNLDMAFKLWDAVYKGTQNADKEFKDGQLFEEANSWLADRR
ncbi:hypothetical protein EYZ11_002375 [Aspergillus tanneri]|uniref:XPG N-terminal domain-containing protein n=1 Tax=Aspergillus tanneri TaxID=1220188 RepID=A0A4S3JU37_9EURO|nr:hypothetical protein EYZ11_002375 [Aspergillus tanneri]